MPASQRVQTLVRNILLSSSHHHQSSPSQTLRRNYSAASPTNRLVSGEWLQARLGQVKILDGTWFLPPVHGPRDAKAEFAKKRIPGAQFFDLDAFSEQNTTLPHMLPDKTWFANKISKELGLSREDTIVVYDGIGQFSAPRVWWMLRVMGAKDPLLLDGGLPLWEKQGRPMETGSPSPTTTTTKSTWIPHLQTSDVTSLSTMMDIANSTNPGTSTAVLDARPPNRFRGIDAEPRPGLRKGKIPNSLNLPFKEVLNSDGTFLPAAELKKVFTKAGIDTTRRPQTVVCTCGSGTTAAVLSFALENFFSGIKAPIYDGSFAEWAKIEHPERKVIDESLRV